MTLDIGQFGGGQLHVINVHLKSRIPTDIPGQKIDSYTWRSAGGWAGGPEIHNEILHGESAAFGTDRKYPESDHAPVVATFEFG